MPGAQLDPIFLSKLEKRIALISGTEAKISIVNRQVYVQWAETIVGKPTKYLSVLRNLTTYPQLVPYDLVVDVKNSDIRNEILSGICVCFVPSMNIFALIRCTKKDTYLVDWNERSPLESLKKSEAKGKVEDSKYECVRDISLSTTAAELVRRCLLQFNTVDSYASSINCRLDLGFAKNKDAETEMLLNGVEILSWFEPINFDEDYSSYFAHLYQFWKERRSALGCSILIKNKNGSNQYIKAILLAFIKGYLCMVRVTENESFLVDWDEEVSNARFESIAKRAPRNWSTFNERLKDFEKRSKGCSVLKTCCLDEKLLALVKSKPKLNIDVLKKEPVNERSISPITRKPNFTEKNKQVAVNVQKPVSQMALPIRDKNTTSQPEKSISSGGSFIDFILEETQSVSIMTPEGHVQLELEGIKEAARNILNEVTCAEDFDVVNVLIRNGLEVIDKRSNGGALWVVGGGNLTLIMLALKSVGIRFKFTRNGSGSTAHRPAWYSLTDAWKVKSNYIKEYDRTGLFQKLNRSLINQPTLIKKDLFAVLMWSEPLNIGRKSHRRFFRALTLLMATKEMEDSVVYAVRVRNVGGANDKLKNLVALFDCATRSLALVRHLSSGTYMVDWRNATGKRECVNSILYSEWKTYCSEGNFGMVSSLNTSDRVAQMASLCQSIINIQENKSNDRNPIPIPIPHDLDFTKEASKDPMFVTSAGRPPSLTERFKRDDSASTGKEFIDMVMDLLASDDE